MKILGIDIGGTKTIVAVADETGRIIARKRFRTAKEFGPEYVISEIKAAGHEVIAEAGSPKIDVIGIGCGGPLNRLEGRIFNVPNLPGWNGLHLTKIFSDEFSAPAYLDNDATAAALGEAAFGAGRDAKNLVFFIVGTGIGGGIILNGRPYRGSNDNAAEFGHQIILPDGPQCTCGGRGCLESLASGTSIAREARDQLEDNKKSLLWQWSGGVREKVTADLVAKAAAEGDAFAKRVWDTAIGYLGIGVANVVNIVNPDVVVLGAGVAKAGDMLFNPVREIVAKRVMPELAKIVKIMPATFGDDVGIIGAVAVALEAVDALPERKD